MLGEDKSDSASVASGHDQLQRFHGCVADPPAAAPAATTVGADHAEHSATASDGRYANGSASISAWMNHVAPPMGQSAAAAAAEEDASVSFASASLVVPFEPHSLPSFPREHSVAAAVDAVPADNDDDPLVVFRKEQEQRFDPPMPPIGHHRSQQAVPPPPPAVPSDCDSTVATDSTTKPLTESPPDEELHPPAPITKVYLRTIMTRAEALQRVALARRLLSHEGGGGGIAPAATQRQRPSAGFNSTTSSDATTIESESPPDEDLYPPAPITKVYRRTLMTRAEALQRVAFSRSLREGSLRVAPPPRGVPVVVVSSAEVDGALTATTMAPPNSEEEPNGAA